MSRLADFRPLEIAEKALTNNFNALERLSDLDPLRRRAARFIHWLARARCRQGIDIAGQESHQFQVAEPERAPPSTAQQSWQ